MCSLTRGGKLRAKLAIEHIAIEHHQDVGGLQIPMHHPVLPPHTRRLVRALSLPLPPLSLTCTKLYAYSKAARSCQISPEARVRYPSLSPSPAPPLSLAPSFPLSLAPSLPRVL